jgi:hypothetical protein
MSIQFVAVLTQQHEVRRASSYFGQGLLAPDVNNSKTEML